MSKNPELFEKLVEMNGLRDDKADQKNKVLALLRQQKCKDDIERMQLKVLEKLVESEFAFDHIGTMIEDDGRPFTYLFAKRAYTPELIGGLLSGVFVQRSAGTDPIFCAYLAHEFEHSGVFDEDEKKLCLKNIEAACILRANEGIG